MAPDKATGAVISPSGRIREQVKLLERLFFTCQQVGSRTLGMSQSDLKLVGKATVHSTILTPVYVVLTESESALSLSGSDLIYLQDGLP